MRPPPARRGMSPSQPRPNRRAIRRRRSRLGCPRPGRLGRRTPAVRTAPGISRDRIRKDASRKYRNKRPRRDKMPNAYAVWKDAESSSNGSPYRVWHLQHRERCRRLTAASTTVIAVGLDRERATDHLRFFGNRGRLAGRALRSSATTSASAASVLLLMSLIRFVGRFLSSALKVIDDRLGIRRVVRQSLPELAGDVLGHVGPHDLQRCLWDRSV